MSAPVTQADELLERTSKAISFVYLATDEAFAKDISEILAGLRDLIAERDATIDKLKASRDVMDRCPEYWQARFVVLSDAWRSGNNDAVLSACMAFVKANDAAPANAKLKDMGQLEEQLRLHKEALRWAGAQMCGYGRTLINVDGIMPAEHLHLREILMEAVRSKT